jgi:hypothetical protein
MNAITLDYGVATEASRRQRTNRRKRGDRDCEESGNFGKQDIMSFRAFLVVVVLMCGCGSAFGAKAYEVVKYKGKADGVTFALDYGDGYPEASEIWVTERKTGKRTRFGLDDSGEFRFVPRKQNGGKREIVLKLGKDDAPGDKIEGTYSVDGKQTQFTLRRQD